MGFSLQILPQTLCTGAIGHVIFHKLCLDPLQRYFVTTSFTNYRSLDGQKAVKLGLMHRSPPPQENKF